MRSLLHGWFARWCLVVPVAGAEVVVASMEGVPTRHVVVATSPCPVVGEIPVEAVSPVVPGAEASLSWCPVLPVNGLLEQDQSPCGRGSIVVCTKRDCRLGSVVVPFGCDGVCRCRRWKAKR